MWIIGFQYLLFITSVEWNRLLETFWNKFTLSPLSFLERDTTIIVFRIMRNRLVWLIWTAAIINIIRKSIPLEKLINFALCITSLYYFFVLLLQSSLNFFIFENRKPKFKLKENTNQSIKNATLFIKYEGIKLQKCLIACKKGINIVGRK